MYGRQRVGKDINIRSLHTGDFLGSSKNSSSMDFAEPENRLIYVLLTLSKFEPLILDCRSQYT